MTDTEACVALNMIPGMGPIRLRKLIGALGSPQRILEAKPANLRAIDGIGSDVCDAITRWESHVDLDAELERIARFGARVVTPFCEDYPPLLRSIHDPPIALYVWGTLDARDRHAIGVVGTRKPSHYATECAKKLAYQTAYAGLTVVSGLARGIDTAAHYGALAAKGRTIAILGSGLLNIYPPENRSLAEKIAANGAVITEFSMTVTADRQTFPMRNRIISGIAFGLLVIEAGEHSGALISASQAIDQGRAVYAVPGRIDQPGCIGSNRLIQNGAKLVLSAADILDDLGILFPQKPGLNPPTPAPHLVGQDLSVYEALGNEEAAFDSIVTKCQLPTAIVSSTLLALELRKLVRQLPGNRFVKTN